jgi:hypothetical protein
MGEQTVAICFHNMSVFWSGDLDRWTGTRAPKMKRYVSRYCMFETPENERKAGNHDMFVSQYVCVLVRTWTGTRALKLKHDKGPVFHDMFHDMFVY